MVATKIKVYSKSYQEEGDRGWVWESDGYANLFGHLFSDGGLMYYNGVALARTTLLRLSPFSAVPRL